VLYDINNRRAEKLVDDISTLSTNLLMSPDPNVCNQLHNSIQEKLDFLREALFRLRKDAA
jgi:hypothetical protein